MVLTMSKACFHQAAGVHTVQSPGHIGTVCEERKGRRDRFCEQGFATRKIVDMLGAMSESALSEGSLIAGRYRLEHPLGEGGMGTVWAATHTVTRRSVAMKFLKDSMRHRKDLRERFLREAAAASALKHPNVVEIIDVFDFAEGCPVMVMELLAGETLGAKLLRDERLSMEETAAVMLPVVSAVGAAHALGIVHRDLKPDNLFLLEGSAEPRVKVLDFGIAKLSAERYLQEGPSPLLTESGSMLGTPCYMAPEQASGDNPVDHRADIWSLGVILYECLSGVRPIEGENLPQVVARLMSAGIMPLERIAPELPAEVASLVKNMLSREVGRRPASLIEVSRTLSHFTNVRAPEFSTPSGHQAPAQTPKTMESARPKARVVAGRGVEPLGPTMLSSPPVNSSLQFPQQPLPAPNRTGYIVGGVAVVLIALAWFATSKQPTPSPASTAELASLPPPPERPAPAAAAAPSAIPVNAVASSAPETPTPPRAKGLKKTPGPTTGKAPPGAVDDSTLFSGRK
jgi:eukaryotic-like serine/threonine-protein kinase